MLLDNKKREATFFKLIGSSIRSFFEFTGGIHRLSTLFDNIRQKHRLLSSKI